MKKKKLLLSIIVLAMIFLLTGCAKKNAVTTDEFKTKAESLNYTVVDVTEQFSTYADVVEAVVAKNENYQVEFYVLTNADSAKEMFNTNKEKFKNTKGNTSVYNEVSMSNYENFGLKTDGKYMYVNRVDNTLIYVDTKDDYKEDIKTLIKKIGY